VPRGFTAALVELGFGFREAVEQIRAADVEQLPLVGEGQLARGPVEQPGAETLFQVRDLPGNRRFGGLQGVGGGHEAAVVHHGGKRLHFLELVH